jgi:hypothetical protein
MEVDEVEEVREVEDATAARCGSSCGLKLTVFLNKEDIEVEPRSGFVSTNPETRERKKRYNLRAANGGCCAGWDTVS